MKNRLSLQSRVLIGCLLVVVFTVSVSALVLEHSLESRLIEQSRRNLFENLLLLEAVVHDRWQPGQPIAQSDGLADQLGKRLGQRVTLIRPDGVVVGDSRVPTDKVPEMDNHAGRPEVAAALRHGLGHSIRYSATRGIDFVYAARRLDGGSGPLIVVRAALPLARVNQTLSDVRRLVLYALALGILLSVGAAYLVARGISQPVRTLTATASGIAAGNLSSRFGHYPDNEIGELGRAFDRMADNLKERIEQVTQGRDRMQTILAGMVEGVLVADQSGRVVLANQALRDMLDIPQHGPDTHITEMIRSAELLEAIRAVRANQPHVSCELEIVGPHPRYMEAHVVALPGGDEGQGGLVTVLHDVTERKRIDIMRREFVANVSHELRTPLTAIRGSAETLLDGALESAQYSRHFVNIIARQARRMERLAEDLMELASLESGDEGRDRDEFEAIELADAVLDAVGDMAAAKGVELSREVPHNGLTIRGDRHQLEQAVLNLVDNGIKYTQSGGMVSLSIEQEDGMVVISVSDTGPGIEAQHLPRLFERFYRVDKDRSREMGGTGLGLAIVKHVAQAHQGKVEVLSKPGRGSTFRLNIPLKGSA